MTEINMLKLIKFKLDWIVGSKLYYSFFGLTVFCIFGRTVIFLVIWFSIYSVLWIRSDRPARYRIPNVILYNCMFYQILFLCWSVSGFGKSGLDRSWTLEEQEESASGAAAIQTRQQSRRNFLITFSNITVKSRVFQIHFGVEILCYKSKEFFRGL